MADQHDDDSAVRARVDRFRTALVELGMQLANFRAARDEVETSERALTEGLITSSTPTLAVAHEPAAEGAPETPRPDEQPARDGSST